MKMVKALSTRVKVGHLRKRHCTLRDPDRQWVRQSTAARRNISQLSHVYYAVLAHDFEPLGQLPQQVARGGLRQRAALAQVQRQVAPCTAAGTDSGRCGNGGNGQQAAQRRLWAWSRGAGTKGWDVMAEVLGQCINVARPLSYGRTVSITAVCTALSVCHRQIGIQRNCVLLYSCDRGCCGRSQLAAGHEERGSGQRVCVGVGLPRPCWRQNGIRSHREHERMSVNLSSG